ncbi:DUF448 domain-containing protein [Helicobacter sp. 23-1044]
MSKVLSKKAIMQRMCVACRGRFAQDLLKRLQIENGEVVAFRGFGRSFYLCDSCIESKNCEKILQKIFKINITKENAQVWQSKK